MDPNQQSHSDTPSQNTANGQSASVIDNVKPVSVANTESGTGQQDNVPAAHAQPAPIADVSKPSGQPNHKVAASAIAKPATATVPKNPSHNSAAMAVILAIIVIIILLAVAVFAYIHSQNSATVIH